MSPCPRGQAQGALAVGAAWVTLPLIPKPARRRRVAPPNPRFPPSEPRRPSRAERWRQREREDRGAGRAGDGGSCSLQVLVGSLPACVRCGGGVEGGAAFYSLGRGAPGAGGPMARPRPRLQGHQGLREAAGQGGARRPAALPRWPRGALAECRSGRRRLLLRYRYRPPQQQGQATRRDETRRDGEVSSVLSERWSQRRRRAGGPLLVPTRDGPTPGAVPCRAEMRDSWLAVPNS